MTEDDILICTGQLCPYCGKTPVLTDSAIIYGKSYGMIYLCKPCDAYVGVHRNTTTALGRLANAELRKHKKLAHEKFDALWKNGCMSRSDAYAWLSKMMNIEPDFTHIGMFNKEQCLDVFYISEVKLELLLRNNTSDEKIREIISDRKSRIGLRGFTQRN